MFMFSPKNSARKGLNIHTEVINKHSRDMANKVGLLQVNNGITLQAYILIVFLERS